MNNSNECFKQLLRMLILMSRQFKQIMGNNLDFYQKYFDLPKIWKKWEIFFINLQIVHFNVQTFSKLLGTLLIDNLYQKYFSIIFISNEYNVFLIQIVMNLNWMSLSCFFIIFQNIQQVHLSNCDHDHYLGDTHHKFESNNEISIMIGIIINT